MKSLKPGVEGYIKHTYTFGPYAYGVVFDGDNREIMMKAEEVELL